MICNRPAPPLPHLYISEEITNEVSTFIRNHINVLLRVSEDITLDRDSRMFVKVALSLLLISVIGSLTDFLTLVYTGIVILLTVPALYERYEDHIDRYALMRYRYSQHLFVRFDAQFISKVQK
ncbi:unnamed protein product [Fraxinus pennsylvanica]|uniref:Reticulon-like protein n=1 Tax=Fraxinus pennsylvanica TaxID=56036 RepID=A0AAD2E980_9LAMI|nr:unnamed protein product [Fraxinus pennsylvanica]